MKLNNTYYLLRHGEALSNARDVFSSWPETFENYLTDAGVAMIKEAAEILRDKNIDIIFASDILRTKETAQIVADALGLSVNTDARLREISFGELNGRPVAEMDRQMGRYKLPGYAMFGGEDYADVSKRMYDFFQEVEKTYSEKTILIVSHQASLCLLEERVKGFGVTEIIGKIPGYGQIAKGEVRQLTPDAPSVINEEIKM